MQHKTCLRILSLCSIKLWQLKSATQRKLNVCNKLWLIIFLFVVLFFVACSEKKENNEQVFYYNETTGVATLDPAFARNQSIMWVVHQLYNTLVEMDSNLNISPSLAKSWEISEDRLRYTFHLRAGICFQDNEVFAGGKGRLLTAHDVVYSLQRITDKRTASSGAWIFNNRIDTTEGFKAIDDSTFQLKLLRPFQPILGILSMQYCRHYSDHHSRCRRCGQIYLCESTGAFVAEREYWHRLRLFWRR